jgi:SSS family solute:Na+ symporter
MNTYYLTAFVGYFAFFLGISIFFYKKNSSANSFLLGNRSMNYWVTALTTQASDMSDWLFMAYPGLIYGLGLFNLWVAIGLVVFMFLNWHFIAPRLRVATETYESITLASFFERHFKDKSGTIRLLCVFFTTYFLVYYIGAELVGLGRLFETTFGIPYHLGITISGTLVVVNIIIGGFIAAAWSDAFRGIFLALMICIVPIVAFSTLTINPLSLESVSFGGLFHALVPDYSWNTISQILLLSMGWGLGYFGSPHILINFMSIRDVHQMSKAKFVGISWMTLVLGAATIVGLMGLVYFKVPLANRELVFIEMVKDLFHPLFAGLILCAILAATMSVMTSQILATASLITEDLFKPMFGHSLSTKQYLRVIEGSIIALPILSYLVSYTSTQPINDLIAYAWSGLGLSFAPTVIAALYIPWAQKTGVQSAMLLGGLLGMFWGSFGFTFMPLLPGFILCFSVLLIISRLTKPEAA